MNQMFLKLKINYDLIKNYSQKTYTPNMAAIGKKYKKDSGKVTKLFKKSIK